MAVAFLIVAALGTIGFTRYQESRGPVEPITSRIYQALQLFVLEGGAVAGPAPWELELARLAAPLVAAYAIVQALALVFREQVEALRLRLVHDHVVVAGLGRKGQRVVDALLDAGTPTVVVEVDGGNAGLDAVRARGALAVVGDAQKPGTLRRAGLHRARQLVALCGSDVVNAEVVSVARGLAAGRRMGTLRCVAHIVDPELCLLLTGRELERYGQAPIRIDFVNVHAVAAQAVLRAHPPLASGDGASARVAIFGSGQTAQHLALAIARLRVVGAPIDGGPLPVFVPARDAPGMKELAARHAEVARFLDVRPLPDPAQPVGEPPPDVIYVCPDDDEAAVSTTLRLRSQLAGRAARIVTVMAERMGLAHLLDGAPQPAGGPTLATFAVLDEVCRPELLLLGTTELLAEALHRAYLEARGGFADAGGAMPAEPDPALRPWLQLPDDLRESNRDQAAHVAVKLAAIGEVIGPLVDADVAGRQFTDEQVETMARLEHDRWWAERRAAGWRAGERDPSRRLSPFLVPWEELSEDARERDRQFVRQVPRLLASVGLQAVRPSPSGITTTRPQRPVTPATVEA